MLYQPDPAFTPAEWTPGESGEKIPHTDPAPMVQEDLRPRCGVLVKTVEGSVAKSTLTSSLKCSLHQARGPGQ